MSGVISPRFRFALRSLLFVAGLAALSALGLATALLQACARKRRTRLRLARFASVSGLKMAERVFPGIVYLFPFSDRYYRLGRLICPKRVTAGDAFRVRVVLENLGSERWDGPEGPYPVRLGTWNPENHGSPFRHDGSWLGSDRPAGLNAAVEPGGTGLFDMTFLAPREAGSYREELAPVADGLGWFPGEKILVRVDVRLTTADR